MNPSDFEEELSGRFGWKLGKTKKSSRKLYVSPEPEIFENLVEFVFEDNGARLATITCHDGEDRFTLLYHFSIDGGGLMVTIKLPVEKDESPTNSSGVCTR